MAATITDLFVKVFLIVFLLVNFQLRTTSAWPLSAPGSIWYKPLNKQEAEVQQITSAALINATDSMLVNNHNMTLVSSGSHSNTSREISSHAKVSVVKRDTSASIKNCEVQGSTKDVFVPGYGILKTRTCRKYALHGNDCFSTRKKACRTITTIYNGSDSKKYSIDYCACAPPGK